MEAAAAILASISQGLTAVGSMVTSRNNRGATETAAISANLSANAANDKQRVAVSAGLIAIVLICLVFIVIKTRR